MTKHQAPEVTSELVDALGSIVSMLADARDTFPDHETTLEAVTEAVNELYGCLIDGVFGSTRATQPQSLTIDDETVERLRSACNGDDARHEGSLLKGFANHVRSDDLRTLLDRLQSLSQGDADLVQSVAAWRDHFAPDGKRIRLDPANKESLHAVLGRVVAALAAPKHGEMG